MKSLALMIALLTLMAGRAWADPCTAPLPTKGARFEGVVRYVGDGDSLCVGKSADPATWIEVRIADFYAPELSTPAGKAAKATLKRLAHGKPAHCVAGKRSYDRVVATCKINGQSLGQAMRAAGVAEGGRGGGN